MTAAAPPPHAAHASPALPDPRAVPTRAIWVMLFALITAFALSQACRTVAAIMENYQTADGRIRIPDALLPYFPGQETL